MSDSIGSMKCVNHQPESRATVGKLDLDMNPLIDVLLDIREVLVEMKPTVNVTQPDIVVNVPDCPIHVNLPEISPRVEVHPAEVVMQKVDGTTAPIFNPKIEVHLPKWPFILMCAVPTALFLVDLILRFHG